MRKGEREDETPVTVSDVYKQHRSLGLLSAILQQLHVAVRHSWTSEHTHSHAAAVPSKFHNFRGTAKKNDPVPLKLWTKSPPLQKDDVNQLGDHWCPCL